jgi:hypothetical protein
MLGLPRHYRAEATAKGPCDESTSSAAERRERATTPLGMHEQPLPLCVRHAGRHGVPVGSRSRLTVTPSSRLAAYVSGTPSPSLLNPGCASAMARHAAAYRRRRTARQPQGRMDPNVHSLLPAVAPTQEQLWHARSARSKETTPNAGNAREARKQGKSPSAAGVTLGASKQRETTNRKASHQERLETPQRGKRSAATSGKPRPGNRDTDPERTNRWE